MSNEPQGKGHWQQVEGGGPSFVTLGISGAGKWMLCTETLQSESLEKTFSSHLCQGLSQLWGPSQGQPQQLGAGSITGQNRQQPQQAALQEAWDHGDRPRLSSPSLAQCMRLAAQKSGFRFLFPKG